MCDTAEAVRLCAVLSCSFPSMACRDSRGSVILACVGLFVFVMSPGSCTKLTRLKALDRSREPSRSQLERSHQRHGRLLIGQSSLEGPKLNGTNSSEAAVNVEAGFQADMGWQTKQLMEKSDWEKMAMENLLKTESTVECTQDSMKLLVHDAASTPASLIFVDRGHLSPLSLTKLPSSCGYTIRSTQKDLVLVAPYDGCFVVIQENYYVLPLLWWGLPVRMSCPLMGHLSQNPPMVTCHADGMVVKTEWTTTASEIKVNVNGNWESLLMAAQRCVFGIVEHPEGVVITVRYAPCLVKKDGMYSLELAADIETKASCPSLLAAQLKLPQSQVKSSMQESDVTGKWLYPFSTSYPALTFPPAPTASQSPGVFSNPNIPSKPNQGSNGDFPDFSYYTHFPGFPHRYLQNPHVTPTPSNPKVTPSADSFYPHLFYPQSPFPAMPQSMPPVTRSSSELVNRQLPNRFILPLEFPQKPPTSYPEFQDQRFHSSYAELLSQLSNSYPLYLQRLHGPSYPVGSEKGQGEPMPDYLICSTQMAASKPSRASQSSWLEIFKGEVQHLVCVQMEPASKSTGDSQPANPDTPKGQVYEPFYLVCNLESSQLQHSKSPEGHAYNLFYLFCYQERRASKPHDAQQPPMAHLYQAFYFQSSQTPTGVTEPPQSVTQTQQYPLSFPFFDPPQPPQKPAETPQSTPYAQAYPLYPFYPQPKLTQKPASRPPQPETPPSQEYPQFFPFYPQPKPTQKPATQPPQPATPPSQGYPPSFPYFNQPEPHQKPVVTQPPKLATQAQGYLPLFPFYSYPQPTEKPATKPPPPETPQANVYPQLFPYFNQPQPPQKPVPTLQPQPSTPQAQGYPPFFYFYTKPNEAQNPPVTQMPQPTASQSKVYDQLSDFYPKPNPLSKPTVNQPHQSHPPNGQVSQPFYPYQLYTQSKPAPRPTTKPKLKDPEVQQQKMCLYSQLLTENRPPNILPNSAQGQVYGPCQQSKPTAVEMGEDVSVGNIFPYSKPFVANPPHGQVQNPSVFHYAQQPQSAQLSSTSMRQVVAQAGEQEMDSSTAVHGYPVYCPQYCPSGLPNCCLQIAFHQHVYISAPVDGKAELPFYTSISPVSYPGFSQGFETVEIPQKLSAPGVQIAESSTSAQLSSRAPQTSDSSKDFFQPPEGIATLRRSSIDLTSNKEPVYPYFGTESLNPLWAHGAQNMELLGFQIGKSEYPIDPSKLWASSHEKVNPVVQHEPFNIQFPEQTIHSRPNFMSYLGQHGLKVGEPQSKPVEQQPLHKSEYRSSTNHNFKRAIDRFYSPYYMPGDSPMSNGSVEQPSETVSNNSKREHKAQTLHSEPESYVLLQHGPPGREPNRFSDPQPSFGQTTRGTSSKALKLLRQNADPQTLQQKRQELKRLGKGASSRPDNGNLQRDSGVWDLFTPLSDDSNPENLNPELSFSAERLNPEVLKSFEDLWESQTPSEFSQLFLAHVPGKTQGESSALNQLATEMD